MTAKNVNQRMTPKRRKENPEYAEMVGRIMAAYGRRVAAGDIEDLGPFVQILDTGEAALGTAIAGLREQGHSWADIGRGLGMTKQGAHKRFGRSSGTMDAGPNQEDS